MPYTIKTLEAINFNELEKRIVIHIKETVEQDMKESKGQRLARLRIVAQRINDCLFSTQQPEEQ